MSPKLLILLALVLFAAYLVHESEKAVQAMRMERRSIQIKKDLKQRDLEFMNHAISLSSMSASCNHDPFGCVVVKDDQVVGEGWSKVDMIQDLSAHAEAEAIRDACKRLSASQLNGCTLYASCQPCIMCLSLISLSQIEKVFYCVPAAKIDSINGFSSATYSDVVLSKPAVTEIQIMPQQVNSILSEYAQRSR